MKAIANVFDGAVKGFLGLAGRKPDCVGKPLTIDDTTYTVWPESVPAAWPCLSANGQAVTVDLSSNSPNGWIVRSDPPTKDMGVDLEPDLNNLVSQGAYRTLFAPSVGNGTFLLPGGTTHLRFTEDDPPHRVELRADPGVTLINGFSVGLNTLFPESKVLSVPGMTDCVKSVIPNFSGPDPTSAALGSDTRELINCVTSTTDVLSTKGASNSELWMQNNIAAKSLGAILSLGPSLANQLAATLGGLVGEFTGSNSQVITITAEKAQTEQPASAPAILNLSTGITSNGAGLELSPNHFQISKRYHDHNRYYADVNYKWTINRPPNSDLGYCKGHVTVTNSGGAVIAKFDDSGFNACYGGGAFSTNLKLYEPGTYTVTVDVEMERGPALHGVQAFTLDR